MAVLWHRGFQSVGLDPLVYHEVTFVEPHKYYLRKEIENRTWHIVMVGTALENF